MEEITNSVKNRIFLFEQLSNPRVKELFKGFDLLIEHEDRWDHKYRHYEALRYYLLLTCFDMLGEKISYRDFKNWLLTDEARTIEAQIDISLSPIKIAQALFEQYNSKHGVKNKFFNFIFKQLSNEQRKRLFFSVQIRKIYFDGKIGKPSFKVIKVENIDNNEKKPHSYLKSAIYLHIKANL